MSIIKTIKGNLVAISGLAILEKLAAFVLVILIARFAGVAAYGQYAFAVSLASFFVLFCDLGITNCVVRDLSKDLSKSKLYLSHSLSIKSISALLSYGALVIITVVQPTLRGSLSIILLVGGVMILRGLTTTFFAVVRAHQEMRYEAYAGVINRLTTLLFAIPVLILTRDIVNVLWVILIASVLEFVFMALMIRKRFTLFTLAVDFSYQKKMLMASLPFLITGGMLVINYRVDTILLKFFHGDVATGIYNAAYSLVLSLMIIQEVSGKILLPLLSRLEGKDETKFVQSYQQVLKSLIIVSLLIVLVASFFSREILTFFYGAEYLLAIRCLEVLIWSLVFMFGGYVLSTVLISVNREKQLVNVRMLTAALNVSLNILLIPRYSYLGASVATLVSEAAFFLSCYWLSVQARLPMLGVSVWMKLVVPFLAGFVFVSTFGFPSMFVAIPALTLVYACFLIVCRAFTKDEMLVFVRLVRS